MNFFYFWVHHCYRLRFHQGCLPCLMQDLLGNHLSLKVEEELFLLGCHFVIFVPFRQSCYAFDLCFALILPIFIYWIPSVCFLIKLLRQLAQLILFSISLVLFHHFIHPKICGPTIQDHLEAMQNCELQVLFRHNLHQFLLSLFQNLLHFSQRHFLCYQYYFMVWIVTLIWSLQCLLFLFVQDDAINRKDYTTNIAYKMMIDYSFALLRLIDLVKPIAKDKLYYFSSFLILTKNNKI